MALRSTWTQWFPPAPVLTDANLLSQAGKIFIVTGANQGIGFELIKILYGKGAKIYMACRSQEKTEKAIEDIATSVNTKTPGQLRYLHLDLNDLTTIKASASAFAAQESRLHVLWNNAGIAAVPASWKTKQDLEAHIGVNCVGPFLFTQLLIPQLQAAAQSAPRNSVRIIWTSSWMTESQAPKGGMDFNVLQQGTKDPQRNYATSKSGNWLLAVEGAKRYGGDGILSLVQNPGNLESNIWQHIPKATMMFLSPLLHKTVYGAYTALWTGLSVDITQENNGGYIIPWGRLQKSSPRKDIVLAMKDEKDGGSAAAARFWDWCDQETKQYA
ncbi:hypothetical protein BDR22DRAFT_838836 [Usnea florida]